MNSLDRKKEILGLLHNSVYPEKGVNIARKLNVTRQVIVKDIALLRATGENIISTPEGYIIPKDKKTIYRRVFAVIHDVEHIEEELTIIVKYGGTVVDVIVEHPLYGEIRGMLMLKTIFDVQNFIKKYKALKAEPLSKLTGGIHLHTVEVEEEEAFTRIEKELKEKNFFITEDNLL